jgi:hypothetical protein
MRRPPVLLARARAPLAAAVLVFVTVAALGSAFALAAPRGNVLETSAPPVGAGRSAPSPSSTTTVAPSAPTSTSTTVALPATTAGPSSPPPSAPPVAPATTAAPLTLPPLPPPTAPAPPAAPSGPRCLVRLHGKGGSGGAAWTSGDVHVLSPAGNAAGWGGKQWLYFAPASYEAALAGVRAVVDASGCGQVIVNGFSNGGAFAVKLFCRGESFGGRLVGVVADDPVPDHGADGCAPAAGVALTLYWTGALAATAQPGWNCAEQDWTCEGGTTVGIAAYAANAGVGAKQSPHTGHQWYADAPELQGWR